MNIMAQQIENGVIRVLYNILLKDGEKWIAMH